VSHGREPGDGVSPLLVRGTPEDAEALADCHRACWREAYGPLVRSDVLAERLADRASWVARWSDRLLREPALIARVGDQVVGFARSGPSRDPAAPADRELHGLYVRQRWHGSGLGQDLLDAELDRSTGCWLWVLEDNVRARAFYRRNGFAPDGTRKTFQALDAWEVRLVRPAD
jgi:GNAT superfamily N-acetyltransferase